MHIKVLKTKLFNGNPPLKAFMDIAFDELIVKGCKIMDGRNGPFLSLPSIKSAKDGKWYPVVVVDSDLMRQDLQNVALEAYDEALEAAGDAPRQEAGADGKDLLGEETPF